ncbi:hypothetical protein HDE_01336 [Halotydeus destructor]|nr:hypothetical protein HDE_01336 [Halotydeus destructor]
MILQLHCVTCILLAVTASGQLLTQPGQFDPSRFVTGTIDRFGNLVQTGSRLASSTLGQFVGQAPGGQDQQNGRPPRPAWLPQFLNQGRHAIGLFGQLFQAGTGLARNSLDRYGSSFRPQEPKEEQVDYPEINTHDAIVGLN